MASIWCDDIVTVELPKGPMTAYFEGDSRGNAAVVKGFRPLPNSTGKGTIEQCGVKRGDILVSVNEKLVEHMALNEVERLLAKNVMKKRTLRFLREPVEGRAKPFSAELPEGLMATSFTTDPNAGNAIVVRSFGRLPSGNMGAIEAAGARPGDVLMYINNISVVGRSLMQVEELLSTLAMEPRVLLFKQNPKANLMASLWAKGVVTVRLPQGPISAQFQPDFHGNGAVLRGFVQLPDDNMKGAIEKEGIRPGDTLVAVNDTLVDGLPTKEVEGLLAQNVMGTRTLRFVRENQCYTTVTDASVTQVSSGGCDVALSVFRFRKNKEHGSSFVEYEVGMEMTVHGSTYRWTVWKRYSEFERMDAIMRRNLGWEMSHLQFPPKYSMNTKKRSADFAERRRLQLSSYMVELLKIPGVVEFHTEHEKSAELAAFLEVEKQLFPDGIRERGAWWDNTMNAYTTSSAKAPVTHFSTDTLKKKKKESRLAQARAEAEDAEDLYPPTPPGAAAAAVPAATAGMGAMTLGGGDTRSAAVGSVTEVVTL